MTKIDSRRFYLSDISATEHFAAVLSLLPRKGDIFALSGPLGAGKTLFARAFIRELTHPDMDVPSPTFTLMQYYEGQIHEERIEICHADLYRLEDPEEVEELGLLEFKGIILLEWPERVETLLPSNVLHLSFQHADEKNARWIRINGNQEWMERLKYIPEQF